MPDVNMTPHHVRALSAGTSSTDRVSPNKQSSEARKAAQKQWTQKERLPEIRVSRGEKIKATLYCYAAFQQKISENWSQKNSCEVLNHWCVGKFVNPLAEVTQQQN